MENNSILKEKQMANFAVINGGVVENIIVAESLEVAQEAAQPLTCVAVEGHFTIGDMPPVIGDLYNGETFTKPDIE